MRELTDRQRTALWLRAQGLTARAVGRRINPPTTQEGIQDLLHHAAQKLDARDTAHAVFLALTLGVIGPYSDCGTRKAYLRHIRRQEQSCIACRKANTAFVRAQRDAQTLPDPDDAPQGRPQNQLSPRQLDALRLIQDGAVSGVEIGAKLGISDGQARKIVVALMRKLGIDSITYAPPASYPMAVRRGIERGYLEERPDAGRRAS